VETPVDTPTAMYDPTLDATLSSLELPKLITASLKNLLTYQIPKFSGKV
jgi:hypothetical protein